MFLFSMRTLNLIKSQFNSHLRFKSIQHHKSLINDHNDRILLMPPFTRTAIFSSWHGKGVISCPHLRLFWVIASQFSGEIRVLFFFFHLFFYHNRFHLKTVFRNRVTDGGKLADRARTCVCMNRSRLRANLSVNSFWSNQFSLFCTERK